MRTERTHAGEWNCLGRRLAGNKAQKEKIAAEGTGPSPASKNKKRKSGAQINPFP